MTDSSDVKALEKISTEVDESQLKIILSIQCIKAQSFLVNKLKKQSEHQKQTCNFMNNGNIKLETEIKLAEQEVKSSLIALETINLGNIELQKEVLLAKERKIATAERVHNGIKKYEQLWLTSKKRYESIPFIQNYLQIKNKKDQLQENISKLVKEKQKLLRDLAVKQQDLLNLDRITIIEMAQYMVHERPLKLKQIKNKQNEVSELMKEIQGLSNPNENINLLKTDFKIDANASKVLDPPVEDTWLNISKNVDKKVITLPKLQLRNIDLDIFSHKLDKIKKVDYENLSMERVDSEPLVDQSKTNNTDETVKDVYISTYFLTKREESVSKNYSDKKLINILEDIKLDKAETSKIVSKVNYNALQNVEKIGEDAQREKINSSQEKVNNKSVESVEEIVEIDLTNKESSNVLLPPTQFLDLTQEPFIKSSQDQVETEKHNTKDTKNKNCSQEKRVTFGGIMSVTNSEVFDLQKSPETENQLNISTTSEDSYKKIKEIIFKKHNLDLSPEFTYSKMTVTSMRPETSAVTSKFFDTKNCEDNKVELMEVDNSQTGENKNTQHLQDKEKINENVVSQTNNETKNELQTEAVAGFLFTYGPQGIPDSLNVSVSTLGYEDADFAPCIDSSLLLSPKADEQMPTTSENIKVLSQEVPNFLSGLRKTGISFFGNTLSEEKSSTTTENQNCNFTFSFGGDEKKTRGGLFSMFR